MADISSLRRTYSLSLKSPAGSKTFTSGDGNGIDVGFDVSFGVSSEAKCGTITMTGISSERIAQYIGLSILSPADAASKMMRVSLRAGYDGSDFEIMDGYAISGSQGPQPDRTVRINVEESWIMSSPSTYVQSTTKVKVKDAITLLVSPFGIAFSEGGSCLSQSTDFLSREVTIPGKKRTLSDTLHEIKQMTLKHVYICSGTLYILDMGNSERGGKAQYRQIDGKEILSVSGVDFYGMKLRTFLDNFNAPILPQFKVKSNYNPQVNGTYYASGIRYVGRYRGSEWHTEVSCIRKR